MSFIQLYNDSLPDYPADCQPLQDFGFKVIPFTPELNWNDSFVGGSIADIHVMLTIVLFLSFILFLLDDKQLVLRRWLWIMSIMFLFRTLVTPDTRYPALPFDLARYRPENWYYGATLIVAGVHKTSTDMLFSGHTSNWIIAASMFARYSNYSVLSWIFWVWCIIGIFLLLAVREHYLADVVLAVIIAKLVFLSYHLLFDSKYWRYLGMHPPQLKSRKETQNSLEEDKRWYSLFKFLRYLDSE